MALYHFLKDLYPDDVNKLKMVLLRFGMYREYAQMIHEKVCSLSQILTPDSQTPPINILNRL